MLLNQNPYPESKVTGGDGFWCKAAPFFHVSPVEGLDHQPGATKHGPRGHVRRRAPGAPNHHPGLQRGWPYAVVPVVAPGCGRLNRPPLAAKKQVARIVEGAHPLGSAGVTVWVVLERLAPPSGGDLIPVGPGFEPQQGVGRSLPRVARLPVPLGRRCRRRTALPPLGLLLP